MMADKELIDEHAKEIEELKNRAPTNIGGDGVDMNEMMRIFACKSPPDNTINRIAALEALMDRLKPDDVLRRL